MTSPEHVQARQAAALERIAAALEKIAMSTKPAPWVDPIKVTRHYSPPQGPSAGDVTVR